MALDELSLNMPIQFPRSFQQILNRCYFDGQFILTFQEDSLLQIVSIEVLEVERQKKTFSQSD